MAEVQITLDNMHKYAAMLRFQIEAELGHPLPQDAVRAEVRNGQPMIIVAEKYAGSVPETK